MNKKIILALVLVICLSFSAYSQSSTNEDQKFIVSVGTEARTLDPHFCIDGNTSRMIMQIYEGLVGFDTDGKIVGVLAKEWKCADDGVSWTFQLRDDVDFQNGTHFTAEAVKYSFERFMDPEVGSPRRSIALEMIKEITVVDDYELLITTTSPIGDFLQNLASYNFTVMSPVHVEKYGKDISENPCGTGPLALKSWDHGTSMTFERFENYYGELAYPKEVKVVIVAEDATRVMLLESGDADIITDIPPIQVTRLQKNDSITLSLSNSYRIIYIGMNLTNEILSNPLVRKAISYAIDKESIIKYVLGGVAAPAPSAVPASLKGATTNVETYPYNPDKAKELLAEAGYPDGFSIKLYSSEGRYPMDRQVCEAIQPMLAKVGIDAKITVMEWAAYTETLKAGKESELFLLGKNSPTGDVYYDLSLTLRSGASANWTFYSNPVVDDLLTKIKVEIDDSIRTQMLVELQQEMQKDAPWVMLFNQMTSCAMQSDVSGLIVYPNEVINLSRLVRN
jgi:peptide/nickel transport system substrate-binding protein